MTTDQLLEALKPYGIDLQWCVTAGVWRVLLLDWAFWHCEDTDLHAALLTAWQAVQLPEAV